MEAPKFYRDASNRLLFWTSAVSMDEYPGVCAELSREFGLIPHGDFITDFGALIFRDFRRNQQTIELAWDNWMEFTVIAKTPESEPLVQEIANWFAARYPEV